MAAPRRPPGTEALARSRAGVLMALAVGTLATAGLLEACTDGVTPDCTDAVTCAPSGAQGRPDATTDATRDADANDAAEPFDARDARDPDSSG